MSTVIQHPEIMQQFYRTLTLCDGLNMLVLNTGNNTFSLLLPTLLCTFSLFVCFMTSLNIILLQKMFYILVPPSRAYLRHEYAQNSSSHHGKYIIPVRNIDIIFYVILGHKKTITPK